MSQSLLKAEHVKISFGNVHALRDVSLEILPGEIHCLAGENGCGKSTIIKIISGVYQRDGGTIEFDGKKLEKISPIDAINIGIQVIYQDFALFPNLTVAENLALNTELASRKKTVSWKNVRKIAEEAVAKINFDVDLDDKKFTYYMTGREFNDQIFVPENMSEKPVFELKNLTLEGAFEDINFSLRRGEILGITGLLDSGRTELALSMFGLKPADSGEILKEGTPIKITNPRDAIEHKIGYVPEDRLSEGLFLTQSIGDNIIISEIDKLKKKNGQFDLKKRDEEIKRWVAELEIKTKNPDNPATTLSGGNQQRIVLAKWLACNLDVLILNGPTVGVDIGSKHDIHMVLQKLAKQGLGVIIISDDLPEVIQNCNRVLVIKNGKIRSEYDTQKVSEQMIIDDMM